MELLNIENLNIAIGNEIKIEGGTFRVNSGDVILLTGPNGCGKSTIIKLIIGDVFGYNNLDYKATIMYRNEHDILHSEVEGELFRKHVCYVSQEDEFESESVMDCFLMAINYDVKNNKIQHIYEFITRFDIQECFGFDESNIKHDKRTRKLAAKLKLQNPSIKDMKALKFLSMSVRRMSGGQKKLTNIFTNLIRYEFSDMLLLDEPLNNLDYENVRSFSNVLTKIYMSKPELGIILVTHCRSIPIVNRVLEIDANEKSLKEAKGYLCNSCFGTIDAQGYYR